MVAAGLAAWPPPDDGRWSGRLAALVLSALILAPIIAVFVAAGGDSGGLWPHLAATVLPGLVANTLTLMAGTAALSLLFGVGSAWLVSHYRFPGRGVLDWALLLPAAAPAYIVAYAYTDMLEYAGPVQGFLRELFGWRSARDYWFPEIRSMGGAVLVLGSVLYPYVYLMSRVAFRQTPRALFEMALLNGRSGFRTVALPLARPAIVAGLALVLMETMSDFGTVEYFAVNTLTLGIFNVWLGMNNLTAAAQMASVAMLFVAALLVLETYARRRRRFTGGRQTGDMQVKTLRGPRALICFCFCLTPVLLGFLIPAGILLGFVLRGLSISDHAAVLAAAGNSLLIAAISAGLILFSAGVIGLTAGLGGGRLMRALAGAGAVGYAFPGAILAIGVLWLAGAVDDRLEQFYLWLGVDQGLFFVGSMILVPLACLVRFQAVGYGGFRAGLSRIPANMLPAARVLGRSHGGAVRAVILPLLRGSVLAAGLLAFVDVMKELPMTLLLRPFNFETLATYVYQYANDELLEQAALPALAIVLAGVAPVIVMSRAIRSAQASD